VKNRPPINADERRSTSDKREELSGNRKAFIAIALPFQLLNDNRGSVHLRSSAFIGG